MCAVAQSSRNEFPQLVPDERVARDNRAHIRIRPRNKAVAFFIFVFIYFFKAPYGYRGLAKLKIGNAARESADALRGNPVVLRVFLGSFLLTSPSFFIHHVREFGTASRFRAAYCAAFGWPLSLSFGSHLLGGTGPFGRCSLSSRWHALKAAPRSYRARHSLLSRCWKRCAFRPDISGRICRIELS